MMFDSCTIEFKPNILNVHWQVDSKCNIDHSNAATVGSEHGNCDNRAATQTTATADKGSG